MLTIYYSELPIYDEGSVINLRSILRMRIEREEVPWSDILLNPELNVINRLISVHGVT